MMAGAVRQPVDVQALEQFVSHKVPEIKGPIDVKQFGFGQSNPTYLLTGSDGTRFVMRKKPPGKLLSKTAHQVQREFEVLRALESTDVPVPRVYCLCNDDEVIGTSFYVMQFIDGRIIEDGLSLDVEMWRDAVRTLAKLHRIIPQEVKLEKYGRPSGFYDRQIKTFATISKAQAAVVDIETREPVGQIPHIDEMLKFFANKNFQPQDRGVLIHGDYKIDNLVFHATEPRVIGILDWEMSTIGHPLSDLVNLTMPFTSGNQAILPDLADVLKWYTDLAGWDPTLDLEWGVSFGLFRGAVILQGIAARFAVRQASSAKAHESAHQRHRMAESAWQKVQTLMAARSKL